jgi:hypothetical protein
MSVNRRRTTNKIEVNFLVWGIVIFFLIGLGGLFFVYLKNQQYAVGNQSRLVEASLREEEARDEALKAKIISMTSRGALQRRLDEGYITSLQPIRDTAIARVTPPATAEVDGVLRTASRDPESRFGPGVPQRAVNR